MKKKYCKISEVPKLAVDSPTLIIKKFKLKLLTHLLQKSFFFVISPYLILIPPHMKWKDCKNLIFSSVQFF